MNKQQLIEKLEDIGYTVRTKLTHIHPDKNKDMLIECGSCKIAFSYSHIIRGNQKSNCDVELTTDALNILSRGDEALVFTGDGDFAYLIEDLIGKGITIWIVSSKKIDKNGNRRFSTRLGNILIHSEQAERRVRFLHINNWKEAIEKNKEGGTVFEEKENRHEA